MGIFFVNEWEGSYSFVEKNVLLHNNEWYWDFYLRWVMFELDLTSYLFYKQLIYLVSTVLLYPVYGGWVGDRWLGEGCWLLVVVVVVVVVLTLTRIIKSVVTGLLVLVVKCV